MKQTTPKQDVASVTEEQYTTACQWLLPQLQTNLPPHLLYHNVGHVLQVIDSTAYLLTREEVSAGDQWLLMTAALFHDAGFLRGYQAHEALSCDIAKEVLPAVGYTRIAVDAICGMIMATKIPQTPLDRCAEILCDADLFYLGTDDFLPIANTLFLELKAMGFIKTEKEWEEKQLTFLYQHKYFTKTAIAELEPKKRENVAALEKL